MIKLSEKAASKVKEILKTENKEGSALRVGIKGGGCSGYTYTLDFDRSSSKSDQVYDDKGIKILVDEKSSSYLNGTELDYIDSLTGSGFTFKNPNTVRSCGCGNSFQA